MSLVMCKCDPMHGAYDLMCDEHFPKGGGEETSFVSDGNAGTYTPSIQGGLYVDPPARPCVCDLTGFAGCKCGAFQREMDAKKRRVQP